MMLYPNVPGAGLSGSAESPRAVRLCPAVPVVPAGLFFGVTMEKIQPPRTFQPPGLRELLMEASRWREFCARMRRIEEITQEAADQYPDLLRQPNDTSMSGVWDDMRDAKFWGGNE